MVLHENSVGWHCSSFALEAIQIYFFDREVMVIASARIRRGITYAAVN